MSQYQIWPTWQVVFFFFYAYLPAHGINLDTVFNDRGMRNMGRTFKVGRKHHEGMLCVAILSVADRNHSRMDVTQMLYWKDNTLKPHRSFLSFCSRDKCRIIHTSMLLHFSHTQNMCLHIMRIYVTVDVVCVMRSAAVHQTPHIQTSVEVPNAA